MHVAELNIGRLNYPIDDPRMADFVDNLGRVNAERFEGKPVEHDALVDQLKERARTAKLEVLVAGDKDVSLENLLHVMDVARAAGVEDIGIAAKH